MPVPMLISTLGTFGSSTLEELSTVELFSTPTVLLSRLADDQMTVELPPAVTRDDLVFYEATRQPPQLLSRSMPGTMMSAMDISNMTTRHFHFDDLPATSETPRDPPQDEPQEVIALKSEDDDKLENEEPTYITYEKFAEMYACYGPYND